MMVHTIIRRPREAANSTGGHGIIETGIRMAIVDYRRGSRSGQRDQGTVRSTCRRGLSVDLTATYSIRTRRKTMVLPDARATMAREVENLRALYFVQHAHSFRASCHDLHSIKMIDMPRYML